MPLEFLTKEQIDKLLSGFVDISDGAEEDAPENEDDFNFVPMNPLSSFLSARTNKNARICMLTSDFVDKHHNSEDMGELKEILRWLFVGKNKEVANTLKELIVEDGSDASVKTLAARFLLISKILLETATEQLQKQENTVKDLRQQREDAYNLFIF
ncbi:hypothetical protein COU00_01100 [Candidatus Falkowbacteria bacterium CG10_big_fil_rev_8_21_14_0_10_43_11]|uniref:Uncharacterized protein n=1 Tax=Candidatus Falkowbacteria bacterium CG10_big_fil_rev_8_21_14_0_10_43_11 TaxID=1974568 RepID=A0A2M6WMM9_9BACT|nr:MAG: hypothetical protein COU00_01100 [Candidatus Falkowbacteria bacterium CG10_big_fil_rev_8_21_14_0_10_43_11]